MLNRNFKLRPYQEQIVARGIDKINRLGLVYLSMEVRTGKTITAISIADRVKAKKVLFITKKKVIQSGTIQNDFELVLPSFDIKITNYEQVHKLNADDYDFIIIDEAHSLGAFPKPSLRTRRIKELCKGKRITLLSGTPSPESYSQLFHQFWISDFSPFIERNFYAWSKRYVQVKKRYVAHGNAVNDYSQANENLIKEVVGEYFISYTQKEAGFISEVHEKILHVTMKPITYKLVEHLKAELVFEGKGGGVIMADTEVKLMQKVHQIYSGTCKLEDGSATIIDNSKAIFIRDRFIGKKIGIFYKFKAELELLKQKFGSNLTEDITEFNRTDKNIALQIVSGREGISLRKADYLVYFNIDFSATSYWQSKDRMTTKDRVNNRVYWIFSKGGIEDKIYKTVMNKKNYTLSHFKKHERIKIPKQGYQKVGA